MLASLLVPCSHVTTLLYGAAAVGRLRLFVCALIACGVLHFVVIYVAEHVGEKSSLLVAFIHGSLGCRMLMQSLLAPVHTQSCGNTPAVLT